MIDRETQQKIKDAANIVEVVGDYVKLTRRGANYMGLCPFHNERTPSFSVSPQRNFCHCFSCKKGGSPVNFLMEKEGISYTEALLLLAKKYNIPVQERELSDEEKARMSEREAMFIASEWAMNVFHDNLYNTEEGRDIGLAYLYGRGITDEAIRKYKLGYSIDRGDALISKAKKEGFDLDVLKKTGLVGTSQQGRDYDRFRGRVMFPIRNASGKPVAFGGRGIKGEAAKYINSAETPLYKKSNELYGIFEAKGQIIKDDRVFLMEGYLDVIGSWQAGLQNAVASSGTALTENQINLIHRFTSNVTLIYDGDSAGIKASLRGIDMLLAQKMHVKMLLLPEGEDPDSFARKHTPEEFQNYIRDNQTDFIRYKIQALLKNANGNPQEIAAAARSVVNSIACIPDEIERISYIKECSRLMDIDEKVITKQVNMSILGGAGAGQITPQPAARQQTPDPQPAQAKTGGEPESEEKVSDKRFIQQEREILKYCIKYGFLSIPYDEEREVSVIDYVRMEMEADNITFSNPECRKVFDILLRRKDSFASEFEEYKGKVEEILKAERNAFYDRLREQGGSMEQIQKEEKKFGKAETARREDLLKKFATDYSVGFLICHEDDMVRNVVNPLVAERHVLSSIYTKEGNNPVVPEEERLHEIVPRALAELRSEILNDKVQQLRREVARAIEMNDVETQKRLMAQLSKTLFIRSRIAENLGERIISPR